LASYLTLLKLEYYGLFYFILETPRKFLKFPKKKEGIFDKKRERGYKAMKESRLRM
jgi:hypothetical protein